MKNLSNTKILNDIKYFAEKEKEFTTKVLHYLAEVEKRKIYFDLEYKSLHEFCIKHLCYSDAAAQRRIQAMRLLKTLPEVEKDLKSGAVNLTTLALLENLTNKHKGDKKEALERIKNKSKREAEKELFRMLDINEAQPELEKRTSKSTIRVSFELTQEEYDLLQQIKNKRAHKKETNKEVFVALIKEKLRDKPKPITRVKEQAKGRVPTPNQKTIVFERAKGKCQHPGCHSTFALQVDHIKPVAFGGKTELSNLRLLCRAHNQMAWHRVSTPPAEQVNLIIY